MTQQHQGWGRPEWSWQKNLWAEKIERDRNLQLFGEARFSEPPPRETNPIEEQLLQLMPWDEGWDFTYGEKIVYGQECRRGPQSIGNCVGYSHCLLLAAKVAHEILVEGDAEEVLGDYPSTSPVPFIPYSYGAGRCLAGNMCGSGDGSYCEIQIRASMEHGFLPTDTPGLPLDNEDKPQGSSSTGRQWGSSRALLNEWRPMAVAFDLQHSYEVNTTDKLWQAIVIDKHPVQICSNWGFAAGQQLGWEGFKFWLHRKSGSWAHSMQIIGAWAHPNTGDRFFKIGNQWGANFHKDGWWFVVDADTMGSWLREADARTIGEVVGRPSLIGFPM